jgi:HlyD family secretion protein
MKTRMVAVGLMAGVVLMVSFLVLRVDRSADALLLSGTVEAMAADLGFNAPGRLAEVTVREGDLVVRGQELARLDAAELEARARSARAQATAARAALAELEAGSRREEVSQGQSAVRAAARRLEDADRDLVRARRLYEGGAISREALDRAETGRELAEAAVEQARDQLGVLESGARPERIAAQRATLESAEAMAQQAEVALENAVIRAPFDGRVTLRHREPGESVQPGLPVLTVMNPSDRWVRIYVPETRLGAIAIGQRAAITADTFRGKEYAGRVAFVASSAEFTPRNVQTREERVKLVYAVRVEVTDDPGFELKPGMPADVRLLSSATPADGDPSRR